MTVEAAGGTQTSSTGQGEITLATLTTAGVYTLATDLSAMALGDQITLRIKLKVRSASSSLVFDSAVYTHTQSGAPVILSAPVPVPHEAVFTLEQNSGAATIDTIWAAYRS